MRKIDRHITPAVVIAGMALVGAAGWFVPQASPPLDSGTGEVDARTTVVCATDPDDDREFELVAAGNAGGKLRLAELGQPDDLEVLTEPGAAALKVETNPYGVVATGPMTTSSASALLALTGSGADRGLSAQPCRGSGDDHWFVGVGAGGTQFSTVLVTNPDAQPAEVSIRFHGPEGPLNAVGASGIEVPPLATRAIPLEGMLTDGSVDDLDGPMTIEVRTTAGRVEAVVHDRHQDGTETTGADWTTATVAPALSQVIPGVPAGAGERSLVVTNPGERSAVVRVEALGVDGAFVLDGADEIDVPAGATVRVPLEGPLQGDAAGLRITSDQPVVAGLNAFSEAKDRATDVTTPVAVPPIVGSAILPIVSTADVKGTVQLSNAGDQPATAEVVLRDRNGKEIERSNVELGAGATGVVEVDDPALWAEVITEADQLHVAVVLTSTRNQTAGLAWLPAISPPAGQALPPAVVDPRVAR